MKMLQCGSANPSGYHTHTKPPSNEPRLQHLRFSPVWLYICVCNELGRVNRLSQTLHLCFFWVLEDTLELNWPIIDCGAGGGWVIRLGRGRVLDVTDSISEPAVE